MNKRYFAEHCPAQAFGQQAAAQLPWFHIVTLQNSLPTVEEPESELEAIGDEAKGEDA